MKRVHDICENSDMYLTAIEARSTDVRPGER